jgi:DNA excision repair protein ERCC-2
MAQPFRAKDQEGISTWSMDDLRQHQEKMDEDRIKELQAEQERETNSALAAQVATRNGRESDYEMDDDDEAEMMALDNEA